MWYDLTPVCYILAVISAVITVITLLLAIWVSIWFIKIALTALIVGSLCYIAAAIAEG